MAEKENKVLFSGFSPPDFDNSVEYDLQIRIVLHYEGQPESGREAMRRDELEREIDSRVAAWMTDVNNRSELVNKILR